jgi:uncharacterized protein
MKIAIIGTGISGLGAAHVLHPQHEVHCFEKESYIGGHSHTVDADGQPVDTGFIVYNERNYPKLTRLFRELKVETIPSDMSFGVYHPQSDFAYASHGLTSLLASPRNLLSGRFYRMLYDVIRFNRLGRKLVAEQRHTDLTLADFLRLHHFSPAFEEYYITPMSAAIWSAPPGKTLGFPALTFMRFFHNHGLLSIAPAISWRTVKGGSREYVQALTRPFADRVHVKQPVALVRRSKEQVHLSFDDGPDQVFDRVIIATHADQALDLLANPTDEERRLLRLFPYQHNKVVLHNDVSVLPPHRRAWASWNVLVPAERKADTPLAMTYDMNRLQSIPGNTRYLVTLNPDLAWLERLRAAEDGPRLFFETEYEHPAYSTASFQVQAELAELNGQRLTCFCGAYCGYGFHEDGLAAGVRAADALGVAW